MKTADQASRAETLLTVAAAGIATGVAVTGMWQVFGDALGITSTAGKIALSAFLEIALLASALRARANLRATGRVGVDGAAVWVMAALSGVFSAWDQDEPLAKAVRLAAPLVAAWLWERGLAADRRAARDATATDRVAWRITPARVAVWLRLADPERRAATDVDRARRLARLTRSRLRVAVLESATGPRWVAVMAWRPVRLAWARWRLTRQALAAVEHLALGADPRVAASIRSTVAAVVGLPAATDPDSLAGVGHWAAANTARQPRVPATRAPQLEQPDPATGDVVADAAPPVEATPAAGPVAVLAGEVADMSVADQVAWFARQLPRHPGRTVAEWTRATGLAQRTVERRIAAARRLDDPGEVAR